MNMSTEWNNPCGDDDGMMLMEAFALMDFMA